MGYAHLAREERYYIYQAVKSGTSLRTIAHKIGRNVSTVSRELARNTGARGYRYRQAEKQSQKRQASKGKKRICPETWAYVEQCLRKDFSPEQISGVLKRKGFALSHEWIYQYVMADKRRGGTLHSHLRCQRKRKRRYGKPDKRGQIKGRISIDTRPTIVAERTRLGDWEADTVEGSKGGPVLVTLAERKSRLFLVGKALNKSASEVQRVIERLLTPIKDFVHTVTYDNGKEFSYHAEVSATLNAQGFFAHPYHSWERGLNENFNGLLRQYFPKGASLASITQDEIIAAMCRLNWRPRKCLGFKTPYEAFCEDANIQVLGVAL